MDNDMVKNKKKGNVLLISMSKLPQRGSLRPTEYEYRLRKPVQEKEGYIKFKGYSQLEPIPVSLIWRLAARGEKLDKIVVINNDATLKEVDKFNTSDGVNNCEYTNTSAYAFFVERVQNYKFDSIEFFTNNDVRIDLNRIDCSVPEIISVIVDDENAMAGIYEVCNKLREDNKDYDELNLFLDIHGGLRSQQIIVDSVISILEHEGIVIYETYSVEGNPPNMEIVNADESINIFNLIAGVNEFINYGRSNSLVEYINGLDDEKKDDKELISVINEISSSLQLCRMDDFSREIVSLKKVLDKYENCDNGKLLPVISLIKQNYTDLLKDESNLVSQIEWCVNHEFYQQALTIIESLIPAYLFQKQVIWYEAKSTINNPIEFKSKKDFGKEIICRSEQSESDSKNMKLRFSKFICHCKSWWMEIENYLFENCTECVNEHEQNGRRKATLALQKTKDDYFKIDLRFDGANSEEYRNEFKASKVEKDNNYKWVSDIWLKTAPNKHEDFNRFAQIHFLLKNQRNLTNHAKATTERDAEERADVSQIKTAIQAYIDLLKLLLGN